MVEKESLFPRYIEIPGEDALISSLNCGKELGEGWKAILKEAATKF